MELPKELDEIKRLLERATVIATAHAAAAAGSPDTSAEYIGQVSRIACDLARARTDIEKMETVSEF